jgi:1-deoxy-D-xylulose-5-phosphate synthase
VPFDPDTGDAITVAPAGWTSVFREELVRLGEQRSDLVAITAAMTYPTGLDAFATRFPERTFDVGIAEQHAVTSAAGLALGGMHPVVAVYATFLNRAFDQVLLDVALHRCGVTFVLDRAGVTGDDGASHNGMWDMSILQLVPGLRLAAPRDGAQLRELLGEAVAVGDAPTAIRYPKGAVPADLPALERVGCVDVLARGETSDVLLVATGSMVVPGLDVAAKLEAQDIGVTLVDPRWVLPVDDALVDLAAQHRLVVSVEDNGRAGGVGSALLLALDAARVDTPVRVHAVPQQFLEHARRDALLEEMGLTAEAVTADTIERWSRLTGEVGGMSAPAEAFVPLR